MKWDGKVKHETLQVFFEFSYSKFETLGFQTKLSVYPWEPVIWTLKKSQKKRARKLIMMGCFPVAFPYQKAAGVVLVFSKLFQSIQDQLDRKQHSETLVCPVWDAKRKVYFAESRREHPRVDSSEPGSCRSSKTTNKLVFLLSISSVFPSLATFCLYKTDFVYLCVHIRQC